jgi:ABC-type glycerol-3-phosphate transport system substrate-binding protein
MSRREFLRLTTLAAGGTVLAACSPATPATEAPEQEMEVEETSTVPHVPEQVTLRWQDWSDWEPDMDTFMDLAATHLPNITIEFEPLGDDFADKTLTMMIAGAAPDVMTA